MKTNTQLALAALVTLTAGLTACGDASQGTEMNAAEAAGLQLEEVTCGLRFVNGTSLNGTGENGNSFNGNSFNGSFKNGFGFNGYGPNGEFKNGGGVNGKYTNGEFKNGGSGNGISLNGFQFNGWGTNGEGNNGGGNNGDGTNGWRGNGEGNNGGGSNGMYENGVNLAGEGLAIKLEGGALVVEREGERFTDTALVGGLIDAGVTADGRKLELRIDAVEARDTDHRAYTMTFRAGEDAWQPVCTDLEGQLDPTRKVTVLDGTWNDAGDKVDSGLVTLACDGFGIAKCVGFGYAPWRTQTVCQDGACSEVSLAAHHQACTRMIRADYCGDGLSHTVNGTLINLYDGIGVQADEGGESWKLEAEWTTEGATCIRSPRIAALDGECSTPCLDSLRANPLPECGSPEHLALRGDPAAAGQVLIMTEHPAE